MENTPQQKAIECIWNNRRVTPDTVAWYYNHISNEIIKKFMIQDWNYTSCYNFFSGIPKPFHRELCDLFEKDGFQIGVMIYANQRTIFEVKSFDKILEDNEYAIPAISWHHIVDIMKYEVDGDEYNWAVRRITDITELGE